MNNYWAKRMKKAQEDWSNQNIRAINAQMRKYYATAMRRIISDYIGLYESIMAKRLAGEEVSVSNLYALDRYWELQNQLQKELQLLGGKQEALLSKKFEKEYKDIHKIISIKGDTSFTTFDKMKALTVAKEYWVGDGKNYSQRIWGNVNNLQQFLNDELVACVSAGRKTSFLKAKLVEKFNVSMQQADTLVRTEIAHIEVESSRLKWMEEGITKVQIYVDEDERTCPQCGALEGKIYDINDTMPVPVHPNCRCTLLPVIE